LLQGDENLVTAAHGKNNQGVRHSSVIEALRGREWKTGLIFKGDKIT